MININIKKYLFHAIRPYEFNLNYSEKMKEEIKILLNIITSGAIFSRRNLKEILSEEEWNRLDKGHWINWNKFDWVSIASKDDCTINYLDNYTDNFATGMHAFHEHILKYPSIILNSTLLSDLTISGCCDKEISCQKGEIQVKDKIPCDYFIGVALPNIYDNSEILKKFNSENSIYYLLSMELRRLDIEDFLSINYEKAISFEKALKSINSTLPIYHIETGNPILPYNQELEKLAEVKRIILKK